MRTSNGMTKILSVFLYPIRILFTDRLFVLIIIVLSFVFLFLLFTLQIIAVPGNDFYFQARILKPADWILLAGISVLNAIFVAMYGYIRPLRRSAKLRGIAVGGLGMSSGIMASLFGAATCSLCIGGIFGFLGANSVFYLVNHRNYIVLVSLALLLIAIYVMAKRFQTECETCRVIR